MAVIKVKECILNNINHEDGSRVYHRVKEALQNRDVAIIDFESVDIVTSSFLNMSFRLLAMDYEYNFLKENITITNSTKLINKMVMDSIKEVHQQRGVIF